MERIVALNQSQTEPTIDVDTTFEKVLNEEINQYSHALQAKQNGQYEEAANELKKILQTEEIDQVSDKSSGHEQFQLKYCCYKNLAEICELQGSRQIALEYFLKAYSMDNTDVFFMNKFGHIALQQEQIQVANVVFRRCLQLNPEHIPSYDGILKILCHEEDYLEAYGWAIHCHKKFPKYQRAIDVILDVQSSPLKESPLIRNAFTVVMSDKIGKRSSESSLFPAASYVKMEPDEVADFTEFFITNPSFLTFGHMIESVNVKFRSTQVTSYLMTELSLSDICNTNTDDLRRDATEENLSKSTIQPFSEWSACNNPIIELGPIQTIFQGILPQYFSVGIDEDININPPSLIRAITQPNYLDCVIDSTVNGETFHINSLSNLCEFINTLKAKRHFCMLDVSFEWLKWMSKCSHIQLPIELQTLYINIFEIQSNHVDWSMWDGLPHTKTFDLFVIAVFYIELKIVSNVRNNAGGMQRIFDDQMIQDFHHILCGRHLFIGDGCDVMLDARLNLLHFQYAIEANDLELATDLLNRINAYFTNKAQPIQIICLPNQMYCTLIDPWIIANEMKLIECLKLVENTIKPHRSIDGFERIDDVVSMVQMFRERNFQCKDFRISHQIELLMESLWLMDRWQDCLHWCEIGLHESMRTWYQHKANNHHISEQFTAHIQFLTIYLQDLVQKNCLLMNSLGERMGRLVRSMAYFLEAQYDRTTSTEPAILLFDSRAFIETLCAILNSGPYSNAMENQWAALNIITKVAKWLILNNIPLLADDQFLQCTWHKLNLSSNSSANTFHSTELIRLMSHSIFGYPMESVQHENVCTCKRMSIDWNGATLLFTSFDDISNGMSELEQKSLIDDLLNAIPNDVQMILLEAISLLMNFLNDKMDFPHKCIPVKSIPNHLKNIFHRFANIGWNVHVHWPNYGPYSYEQLIAFDLAINPRRKSSWIKLLAIKISQLDKLFNATDLTKINFDDVETLKDAIDTCFYKCQICYGAETIPNTNHLLSYGLFAYKLYNFFKKGTTFRTEFNGICTPKRLSLRWKIAEKTLVAYLKGTNRDTSLAIDARQKFRCYFILGKMIEKQRPTEIRDVLEKYLLAEQQLFDLDDDTVLWMKIEVNFRITASIYKFVVRAQKSIEEYGILIKLLKRDKRRLFHVNQLASRAKCAEIVDENDNEIDGQHTHQQQVDAITKICIDDFEWYLELWPAYYKAMYYLIKINLGKDDDRCRPLLLQLPRKTIEAEKKLSLFDIHRCRSLFKVKEPLQLDVIHDVSSFNKYMEKCVRLLVEYLVSKCNPQLHVVLALQWIKIKKNSSVQQVNQHQKDRLFEFILSQFIQSATNYVNQINQTTAKSKYFGEFFSSLYELYMNCEAYIKSEHFSTFSKLMIACYHSNNDASNQLVGDDEFQCQFILDHCAKKLSEKNQALAEKVAKKTTTKKASNKEKEGNKTNEAN